ncbi:MAG: hypothetical protein A2X52_14915 [Candidatus Rokubacteria bacterium GWC2_70_16]|nr:MAG: hypothetical protein A2X52_14915 [Candidatus Rokubacteria bacterium GWC2_70_16]
MRLKLYPDTPVLGVRGQVLHYDIGDGTSAWPPAPSCSRSLPGQAQRVGQAHRQQFPERLHHVTAPRNGRGPILADHTDDERVLTEDCRT